MKKLEKFLNSGYFIATIFTITLISWSFFKDTPPHIFNIYNIIGIFFLVSVMFLILIFYENTLYITPILISFLFIANKSDMDFTTTTSYAWVFIVVGLIILGPIVHLVKYKVKVKKGHFTIGLLLIAISYVMALIYLPFKVEALPVSLLGFVYLGFYLFLTSTVKGNLDYLFKIMLFANLLLTAELGIYIIRGYQLHPELEFIERIFAGWGRNLGWANVNDMCFYIALTFPSYIYFIYKKPHNLYLWLIMIIPVIVVILSESRGGLIGFLVSFIGVMIFNVLKGHIRQLIQTLVFLSIIGIVFYIYQDALYSWWDRLIASFDDDLNGFSSGRIDIYKQGLEVFKSHPLFGGGWLSLNDLNPGKRWFMYHSTIVQALASMGIFGLIALIIHYIQVILFFFKNITLEKSLFIIGYLASQVHGIIDNVQYAVPYSLLMAIVFAIWERAEHQTIFEIKDKRFVISNQK